MYNGILQLQHHSSEAITKGFLDTDGSLGWVSLMHVLYTLKSKALRPGSGLRETSSFSVCVCVRHLSKSIRRFTRSIPAPDWNQDTCKDLKANPLSDMHAECGSSVTSWHYTLYSYLWQRKRSCLPTVCHPHDALQKICAGNGGGCAFTQIQTVAGQKTSTGVYSTIIYKVCVCTK